MKMNKGAFSLAHEKRQRGQGRGDVVLVCVWDDHGMVLKALGLESKDLGPRDDSAG